MKLRIVCSNIFILIKTEVVSCSTTVYQKLRKNSLRKLIGSIFYGDVTEDLPCNMPEPRENSVIISIFTDAAFAGDLVTRRSQSGILIFINCAPITWYSKQ